MFPLIVSKKHFRLLNQGPNEVKLLHSGTQLLNPFIVDDDGAISY